MGTLFPSPLPRTFARANPLLCCGNKSSFVLPRPDVSKAALCKSNDLCFLSWLFCRAFCLPGRRPLSPPTTLFRRIAFFRPTALPTRLLARALAEQAPADKWQADGLLAAGLDAGHVSELVPLVALHPAGPGTLPNPFKHHPPHPSWLNKWFLTCLNTKWLRQVPWLSLHALPHQT